MKIACLLVLVACAYAHAAAAIDGSENIESVYTRIPATQLKATVHEEDASLAAELPELNSEERNLVANAIREVLEGFRDVIINGNDNLPPLDPLNINNLGPFEVSAVGVRATGRVNNLRAEGLRWYVVDEVTFNALRLAFGVHVTLPWLQVNGRYDAQARILLINHQAGGNFRVFVNRVEVGVDIRVGTNLLAGHLVLRELDINIDIHDTVIQIDGMVGSTIINNFINNLVQSISQDVIQNQLGNISNMLSVGLFDTINEILKDYTLADILG